MTKKKSAFYAMISLCLFVIVWQLYISLFQIPKFILPSPILVFQELAYQLTQGSFYLHLGYTIIEIFIGFSFSIVIGSFIGYKIFKNNHLRELCMPILVFFQVAPKIALVPIFIIWFGLGFSSKLFIVFIMSFFPIIEGIINGLQNVDKDRYALMHILKASKKQILLTVEIPSCLPSFFASLKVGVIQAIIGATVAEWMAGQNGIGYLQTFASSTFDSPLLVAGIFVTILLGVVLYGLINLLETKYSYEKMGVK